MVIMSISINMNLLIEMPARWEAVEGIRHCPAPWTADGSSTRNLAYPFSRLEIDESSVNTPRRYPRLVVRDPVVRPGAFFI